MYIVYVFSTNYKYLLTNISSIYLHKMKDLGLNG